MFQMGWNWNHQLDKIMALPKLHPSNYVCTLLRDNGGKKWTLKKSPISGRDSFDGVSEEGYECHDKKWMEPWIG